MIYIVSIIGGFILLIFSMFQGLVYHFWKPRIPFAAQMLKTVSSLIEEYPSVLTVSYLSLVVEV